MFVTVYHIVAKSSFSLLQIYRLAQLSTRKVGCSLFWPRNVLTKIQFHLLLVLSEIKPKVLLCIKLQNTIPPRDDLVILLPTHPPCVRLCRSSCCCTSCLPRSISQGIPVSIGLSPLLRLPSRINTLYSANERESGNWRVIKINCSV